MIAIQISWVSVPVACPIVLELPPREAVGLLGHLVPSFVGGVLVGDRGPRAGVAHAVHQHSERCARAGRQGVSRVSEIMKVDFRDAGNCAIYVQ